MFKKSAPLCIILLFAHLGVWEALSELIKIIYFLKPKINDKLASFTPIYQNYL